MIEKSLAGPLGVIVKASTLRDYGVDNFFFLENKNCDSSQRNVVFIARGESAGHAQMIAGQCPCWEVWTARWYVGLAVRDADGRCRSDKAATARQPVSPRISHFLGAPADAPLR